MDNTIIARHIKKEWNNFYKVVKENEEEILHPEKFLQENGYDVLPSGFRGWYATKNGLRFYCGRYDSEYRLHIDYGFYVGSKEWEHGKYVRIFNVDNEIDAILAAGYVLPEDHYVRGADVDICIATIKEEIAKAKSLIRGGYGERGDMLYRHGYKVGYDGGSVCDFSKGFLHFSAHNDYPQGWSLTDKYNAYIGDDVFSIDFSLNDEHRALLLDRDFEAIFGDVPTFGRELTEKDKVGQYTKFRVRSYVPKELETIGWFDTFDEAKTFAYEKAKEYAEGVKDDRRRYAYTRPLDISDRYDYLAAYLWYDGGLKHFVFVQGEN